MLKIDIKELNKNTCKNIQVKEVSNKEIAIIGMYVSFPGAIDKEDFWINLKSGVDSVKDFPDSRKTDVESFLAFKGELTDNLRYENGAYFDSVDGFDYKFFHLSPKEADLMDPNQRLFLKAAWGAIEDAGYGEKKIKNSRTGVYIGYCEALNSYRNLIKEVDPSSISVSLPGNLASMIASRISYLLNLKGPAVSIDTACSSSLIALNTACQSLRNKECETAIVGGVRLNLLPVVREHKFGIESSDGKAKTFDYSSDGTGQGEGVVAMLLKPLNRAVEDRDNIYAVIKGYAANQDGASIGITAPNVEAQEEVIVNAWRDADIDPETIGYIEAHGTGTKLGDPIEIDGLERAFKRYTDKKQFCAVGSIKTNIGHLDNAAGIAGLVKAVLALKNKEIPPSLHFKRPNPKIDFESSPVYVNDVLTAWEKGKTPRRCGVSSFGLSGTNCHIVLEEYDRQTNKEANNELEILALSAGSQDGIKRLLENYLKVLKNNESSLKDICYTANIARGHYNYRLMIIVNSLKDLEEKLERLLKENLDIREDWCFRSKDIEVIELSNEEKNELNSKAQKNIEKIIDTKSNSKELLKGICLLYVTGADVDFEGLYKNEKQYKVSVPVYPFDNKRCWINIPERGQFNFNIDRVLNKENVPKEMLDDIDSFMNKWKEFCDEKELINSKSSFKDVKLDGRKSNEYSQVEKAIAGAWRETLGLDIVNIYENFYEAGGDSLLLMNVVNIINQSLNIKVNISEAIIYQTVETLAKHIEQNYETKTIKENEYIQKQNYDVFVLDKMI